eukprot:5567839-Amphidinium_carterae.1
MAAIAFMRHGYWLRRSCGVRIIDAGTMLELLLLLLGWLCGSVKHCSVELGVCSFWGAGFHATAQEAVRRLIETHTIEPNPIIEYFTDAIVAEKGLSHMYADVELEGVVAAAVAETYKKKPGKIGMCRWFEWYEGAAELLSSWSCRLVVLLFVALVHKEVVMSEQLQKRWRVKCATLTSDDADDMTTAEAKHQGPDEKEAPADLLSIALAF